MTSLNKIDLNSQSTDIQKPLSMSFPSKKFKSYMKLVLKKNSLFLRNK